MSKEKREITKRKTELKAWEELTLSNDFLFSKVMRDKAICQEVIELLLDIGEIDRIEYPEEQKAIDIRDDAKGVRLDVYVRDKAGTVYNIEMQAKDTKDLPKRSRYYSGMIDLDLMEKGKVSAYKDLNKSYVIFLCTSDVFGEGRHRYTFRNICEENKELLLGDETTKIFFNTKGSMEDVNPKVEAFLKFIDGQVREDAFVRKLEQAVEEAKSNRKWRREYMTLDMKLREEFEDGIEQGLERGMKYGSVQARKEIAWSLLSAMTDEEIAKVTGLPVEEIKAMRLQNAEQ